MRISKKPPLLHQHLIAKIMSHICSQGIEYLYSNPKFQWCLRKPRNTFISTRTTKATKKTIDRPTHDSMHEHCKLINTNQSRVQHKCGRYFWKYLESWFISTVHHYRPRIDSQRKWTIFAKKDERGRSEFPEVSEGWFGGEPIGHEGSMQWSIVKPSLPAEASEKCGVTLFVAVRSYSLLISIGAARASGTYRHMRSRWPRRGEDAGANAQRVLFLVQLSSTKATKRQVLFRDPPPLCTNTPRTPEAAAHDYGAAAGRHGVANKKEQFLVERRQAAAATAAAEDDQSRVAFFVSCPVPGRVFRRSDTAGPRTQYFCPARTSLSLSRTAFTAPVCASPCTNGRHDSCMGFGDGAVLLSSFVPSTHTPGSTHTSSRPIQPRCS